MAANLPAAAAALVAVLSAFVAVVSAIRGRLGAVRRVDSSAHSRAASSRGRDDDITRAWR